MTRILAIILLLTSITGLSLAQDSTATPQQQPTLLPAPTLAPPTLSPYDVALAKIEDARISQTEVLDLDNLGLTSLPPEIGNLSHLIRLDLDFNELSSLPLELFDLTNLHLLFLGGNQFNALPPEIGNLINLQYLGLNNNQLQTLPPEIGNLTKLCQLNLTNNSLRTLPPSVNQISGLSDKTCDYNGIFISGNYQMDLPNELFWSDFPDTLLTYLQNPIPWYVDHIIQWLAVFSLFFVVIALLSRFIDRKFLQTSYSQELRQILKTRIPNRRRDFVLLSPFIAISLSPIFVTVYYQNDGQLLAVLLATMGTFWLCVWGSVQASVKLQYHLSTLDSLHHSDHPRRQAVQILWQVAKHRWIWHLLCVVMSMGLGLALYEYMNLTDVPSSEQLYRYPSPYLLGIYDTGFYVHQPMSNYPIIPHLIPAFITFTSLIISQSGIILLSYAMALKWGVRRTVIAVLSLMVIAVLTVIGIEYFQEAVLGQNFRCYYGYDISRRSFARVFDSLEASVMTWLTAGSFSSAPVVSTSPAYIPLFAWRHILVMLATALVQIIIAGRFVWTVSSNRKRKQQE